MLKRGIDTAVKVIGEILKVPTGLLVMFDAGVEVMKINYY